MRGKSALDEERWRDKATRRVALARDRKQVQFSPSVKHSLTSGTFHRDGNPTGSPFLRETLGGRKLVRCVLSERPLSVAARWETEYIDRVALCVWFASQKYVGGEEGGERGCAISPNSLPSSQRGLKFPRSLYARLQRLSRLGASRRTFYLVAPSGGWKGRRGAAVSRELAFSLFYPSLFRNPIGGALDRVTRVSSAVRERSWTRSSPLRQNSEFGSLSSRLVINECPWDILPVDLCSSYSVRKRFSLRYARATNKLRALPRNLKPRTRSTTGLGMKVFFVDLPRPEMEY